MSNTNNDKPSSPRIKGTYEQMNATAIRYLTVQGMRERVHQNPHCGITTEMFYFNTMRNPITVVDRTGFKVLVSNHDSVYGNGGGGSLRIVKCITVVNRMPGNREWTGIQYLRKIFRSEESRQEGTVLGELYNSYKNQYGYYLDRNGHNPNEIKMYVEYEFTNQSFRDLDNSRDIYHRETDLLISFVGDPEEAGEHPYSQSFQNNNPLSMTYMADDRLDRGAATLLEIVDNDQKYGYRYVWMANQVFCIKPIVDRGREDGVYLKHHSNGTHCVGDKAHQKRCSLEDMGKTFGLYPSQEEAVTGGNPELLSKAAKLALEKEAEDLKSQYSREMAVIKREREEAEERARIDKLEHDNKLRALELEHSKRITEIKEENEKRALERRDFYEQRGAARKDTYESRSYDRKDKTDLAIYVRETIRVGLVIVAGLIGWFAKAKTSG